MNTKQEIEEIYEKHGVNDSTAPLYIVQGDSKYELREGRIKELTAKLLELGHDMTEDYPDFNKTTKMVSLLVDVKKAWFPAIQKSMTGNVESFDKSLEKWFVLQKEAMAIQKEKNKIEKGKDK